MRLVDAGEGLALARDVAAAAEQIVAHHQERLGIDRAALDAVDIVVGAGTHLEIEARIEAGPGAAQLGLSDADVGIGDHHRRAVVGRQIGRHLRAFGQGLDGRRVLDQIVGRAADHLHVARLGVAQIADGARQGVAGRGKPRLGLADIGNALAAALGALPQAAEDRLMLIEIFLGQLDQLLVAQDVEMGLDRVEGGELGGLVDPIGGRIQPRQLALDLAPGGEAVEQHLGQGQLGLLAQQRGMGVAALRARGAVPGAAAVGVFRPGRGAQVERWQIERPSLADFLIDGAAISIDHPDLGMALQGSPDAVLQRAGLRCCDGRKEHQQDRQGNTTFSRYLGSPSHVHQDLSPIF